MNPGSPPVPIPAPSAACLQQELAAFKGLAAVSGPPVFQVYSFVFANSGTLLLCFVDVTGLLASFRQHCKATFPGAAARQPSIMHMTLARVLRVQQLTPEQRQSIQEACSLWTDKLRGQVFRPEVLTHTQEHQFTTVEGIRTPFPFATKAPIKS